VLGETLHFVLSSNGRSNSVVRQEKVIEMYIFITRDFKITFI